MTLDEIIATLTQYRDSYAHGQCTVDFSVIGDPERFDFGIMVGEIDEDAPEHELRVTRWHLRLKHK